MSTATKPDYFSSLESIKRNEKAKKTGTTEAEQAYYAMTMTTGWTQFTELKDRLLTELEHINDTAVSSGASYEELGKNTVVISLARGVVKQLFDTVEDIREECEKRKK